MVMLHTAHSVHPHKLRRLYWPFLALAEGCREVVGTVAGSFEGGEGQRYTVPRFTFLGPQGNMPQMRIGIFALLHGDEPAGALALRRLLETLVARPNLAAGYDVVCYPVCNPTGYEEGTRENRAGLDLNREFWRESAQPEIRILEEELRTQRFDGIIALHADDTSDGLYGYTHGRTLNEQLLMPALRESAFILPCNREKMIDGFAANDSMICDCFKGILAPPPEQHPRPFEIIFETPALAPVEKQAEATCYALLAMLREYRGFVAQGGDL